MNDEQGLNTTAPETGNADKTIFGIEAALAPGKDRGTLHAVTDNGSKGAGGPTLQEDSLTPNENVDPAEGTRAEPRKWAHIDCAAFGEALDAIRKERAEAARQRKNRSATVREAILRQARKIRTMLEDGYTCADIVDALKACGALVSPGTVRKYLPGDKKEKAKREKPLRKDMETPARPEKPAPGDATGEKHAVLEAPELSDGDRNPAGAAPTGSRPGERLQRPALAGNTTTLAAGEAAFPRPGTPRASDIPVGRNAGGQEKTVGQSPAPAVNRGNPAASRPADWRHGSMPVGCSSQNPLAPKNPAYLQMTHNK